MLFNLGDFCCSVFQFTDSSVSSILLFISSIQLRFQLLHFSVLKFLHLSYILYIFVETSYFFVEVSGLFVFISVKHVFNCLLKRFYYVYFKMFIRLFSPLCHLNVDIQWIYIFYFLWDHPCFWYMSDFWLKPGYFHYIYESLDLIQTFYFHWLCLTHLEGGKWCQCCQVEVEVHIPCFASTDTWPGLDEVLHHCWVWMFVLPLTSWWGSLTVPEQCWRSSLSSKPPLTLSHWERVGMEAQIPIWSPFTLQNNLVIG